MKSKENIFKRIFKRKIRLDVPQEIIKLIESSNLSFTDYQKYNLKDKISYEYLKSPDKNLLEHFGYDKCLTFDWEFITKYSNTYQCVKIGNQEREIINYLLEQSPNIDFKSFIDEIIIKLKPIDFPNSIKDNYKEYYYELDDNLTEEEKSLANKYNNGNLTLEKIIKHWDFFKNKNLTYQLNNNCNNEKYTISEIELRNAISKYKKNLNFIVDNKIDDVNIYEFIIKVNSTNDEEISEYLEEVSNIYLSKIEKIPEYDNYNPLALISNEEYDILFSMQRDKEKALREYIKLIIKTGYYTNLYEELETLDYEYIINSKINLKLFKNSDVCNFINSYGLGNVINFDEECENFFTNNDYEMLKLMTPMYLKYDYIPYKYRLVEDTYDYDAEGNFKRNRTIYSKEKFYEVIRKMLLEGPTDSDYRSKAPDYRKMGGEFRKKNPDLFISKDAPSKLQTAFYEKSLTPEMLAEHPEYIPYIIDKDISNFLSKKYIRIKRDTTTIVNFYEFISQISDTKQSTDFIIEYCDIINILLNKIMDETLIINGDDKLSDIELKIINEVKKMIIQDKNVYPKHIPSKFKEMYPELFLPENAPQVLQDMFYNRTISPNIIYTNPEYVPYLKNVKAELIIGYYPINIDSEKVNIVNLIEENLGTMECLKIMSEYNQILDKIKQKNILNNIVLKRIFSKEQLLIELDRVLYQGIIENGVTYEEDVPLHFKEKHKELFLPKETDDNIKELFYSRNLSIDYFYKNPDLISNFKNTNIIYGFSSQYSFLIPLYKKEENKQKANYNRIKTMALYESINDISYKNAIKKYITECSDTINYEILYKAINLINRIDNYEEFKTYLKEINDDSILKYLIEITNYSTYDFITNSLSNNTNISDSDKFGIISKYLTIKDKSYESAIKGYFSEYSDNITYDKMDKLIDLINKMGDYKEFESNYKEINDDTILKELIKVLKYSEYSFITNNNKISNDVSDIEKIEIIHKYLSINDEILKNEFRNFLICNKNNTENSITNDKIYNIIKVLEKLHYSNSKELYIFRQSITSLIIETDNPIESLDKIEKIFIKNNLPLYGKIFSCFHIIYPNIDNNFNFLENSRMAPELKNESLPRVGLKSNSNNEIRFNIIYNDLLRIAAKSNNRSLHEYLDNIEKGNNLYEKIIKNKINYENLTPKEKEIIEIFISHLETLYENTKEGKESKINLENETTVNKIKILSEKFKTNDRYDLKDRIVRSFGYFAGFDSYDSLRNFMDESTKEADERGRRRAKELEGKEFRFEYNDFLRCIGNFRVFASSINTGNVCKEYLGTFTGSSTSDTTPLDVDFTLVTKISNVYDAVNDTPTGFGFGNVYVIMKHDNPNLNITRDEYGKLTGAKYNPKKAEMFGTGYKTHWGIRTGFSFTDVDYILYKKTANINVTSMNGTQNKDKYGVSYSSYEPNTDEKGNIIYNNSQSNSYDLRVIEFEMVKNGYYIPIIDFKGRIIFTPEEFDKLHEKLQGLSYYNSNEYIFSDNLYNEEVEKIVEQLDKSEEEVVVKRNKIYALLNEVFEKYNLKLRTTINQDLTAGNIEFIDTGSTGRKTNKIGDGDFDFIMRLDQQLVMNTELYKKFQNDVIETLKKYGVEQATTVQDGIRFKGVKLDDETKVDIDISYLVKTDKVTYSTDLCIKDRLETIKKQNPEKHKQVIANIILAKNVLKNAHAYKSKNSREADGGLGGVGVENWILQHGGSFIDAARSFIEVANQCNSYEEFREKYQIWDFGENYFAEKKGHYPHDEFVGDNMNSKGYERMCNALKEYIKKYDEENSLSSMFEEQERLKIKEEIKNMN